MLAIVADAALQGALVAESFAIGEGVGGLHAVESAVFAWAAGGRGGTPVVQFGRGSGLLRLAR